MGDGINRDSLKLYNADTKRSVGGTIDLWSKIPFKFNGETVGQGKDGLLATLANDAALLARVQEAVTKKLAGEPVVVSTRPVKCVISPTAGVVLSIGTTAAQLAAGGGSVTGTFGFTNGLAGALSSIGAKGSITGSAVAAKSTLQDQIDDLQKRIADYDTRLAQRELTLRTKFTAMQDLISKLQANTSSLSQLPTG